jgi:DNA polymerase III delta prime subunit
MRDKVVERTVEMLQEMGEMPTTSMIDMGRPMVGLDAKVEQVVQLLLTAASNRCMVLLHGMPGVGKTTLAQAVFNELHDQDRTVPCCFLSLTPASFRGLGQEGLQAAQNKLRLQLAHCESPGTVLAEELRGKSKVLLVVDNASKGDLKLLLSSRSTSSFMAALGPGSMVLITSRDRTAVDEVDKGCVKYEVKLLSETDAMELFCRHAYDSSSPPNGEDVEEVKGLVARCDRLPKAVELVGTYLGGFKSHDRHNAFGDVEKTIEVAYGQLKTSLCGGVKTSMFELFQSSWASLGGTEARYGGNELAEGQEALLDVVWFSKKRCWELMESCCKPGYLNKLEDVGLLRKDVQQEKSLRVAVHNSVADFCKMSKQQHMMQRVELSPPGHTRQDPAKLEAAVVVSKVWSSSVSCGMICASSVLMRGLWCSQGNHDGMTRVGLWLQEWDLDADSLGVLSKKLGLRMLQLDFNRVSDELKVPLSTHCLGVQGKDAGGCPKLRLQLDVCHTHHQDGLSLLYLHVLMSIALQLQAWYQLKYTS